MSIILCFSSNILMYLLYTRKRKKGRKNLLLNNIIILVTISFFSKQKITSYSFGDISLSIL